MQLDIGFGDAITPGPTQIEYPILLDFPAPVLDAYPQTFRRRQTPIEVEPIGLTPEYYDDPARTLQWRAFVRRSRFEEEAGNLAQLIDEIRRFVIPVLSGLANNVEFQGHWEPGGPWK